MARKPTGKPVGRPETPIDWKMFEQLCHIQCLQAEIASFFKLTDETLHNRVKKNYGEEYSVVYKKYSDGGKSSLRRIQYRLAEKNVAMCIWLGKQYLDQREPQPLEKNTVPANDMTIKELIESLKKFQVKDDAIKRKADSIIPTSQEPTKHLGGCGEERKDVLEYSKTD